MRGFDDLADEEFAAIWKDPGRGRLHGTGTGFIIPQLCTIRVPALLVTFSHGIILPLQSLLQ